MRPLMIAAALALVAAVPVRARTPEGHKPSAPKAACHIADGKAVPCPRKSARGAPKAKTSMPMITQCRDVVSHRLTKCGGPNAEPVPAN